MRNPIHILMCLLATWTVVVQHSHAAPVTDVANPGFYSAPTAAELSDIDTFFASIPTITPDSTVMGLRAAPTVLVNVGLDAMVPVPTSQTQHFEMGTLPLPTLSHSCSPSTPVTIAISESTYLLTGRTYAAYADFGVATFVLDSRDLSLNAPVTAGLASFAGPPLDLGVPATAPATSYVTTFAELAFFTTGFTAFEVAKSVRPASTYEMAQASYSVTQLPLISYQYDDAGCSAVAPPLPVTPDAQPVPTQQPVHLFLLALFVASAVLRRVRASV